MDWLTDNIWALWLIIALIFVFAEAFAGELFLLMFGIGAGAAAAVAAMEPAWFWTVGTFAVVSAGLIYFVRPPIVARLHSGPTLLQGHDSVIGALGAVTQEVTAFDGRILVGATDWTARSATGETLPVGTRIRVQRLDGVTAIVEVVSDTNPGGN